MLFDCSPTADVDADADCRSTDALDSERQGHGVDFGDFKSEGRLEKRLHPLMNRLGLLTPKWALFFISLFAVLQSMTVSGLFPSSVSSLERRYGLRSSQTGFLASLYDVLVGVLVLVFAFVSRHKPRALGACLALLGLGTLFFAAPEMFGPAYADELSSGGSNAIIVGMCTANDSDTCAAANNGDGPTSGASWSFALLIIGQSLIGIAAAPLYVLGPV